MVCPSLKPWEVMNKLSYGMGRRLQLLAFELKGVRCYRYGTQVSLREKFEQALGGETGFTF